MEAQTFGTGGTVLLRDVHGIESAVELITKDTRHREMRCLERRTDSRLPFQRAVEVFILTDERDSYDVSAEAAITAYTRDISVGGVGMLHDQAIHSRRVLLRFELLGGETIGLVASLTWCRYLGDFWYSSGGRLIGVVSARESKLARGMS